MIFRLVENDAELQRLTFAYGFEGTGRIELLVKSGKRLTLGFELLGGLTCRNFSTADYCCNE